MARAKYQVIMPGMPVRTKKKKAIFIWSCVGNPHLSESETDVHIEALINWDEDIDIPSQVPGSFIPYLKVRAKITNQETDASKTIDLVPHINLIDGFHYARNTKLPGSVDDTYQITFTI